jgi:hypothetical protein
MQAPLASYTPEGELRMTGRITVRHRNGELRELDSRTHPNGNVTVRWPLVGLFTFDGKTGACLEEGMRSWRLADVREVQR